ncbi:hypothetical protein CRENBAI_008207 [Crenichthys baileyi]|uniref:BESS domain-containing protein n=1 Tax=Crenichthys baileyi TaxID=28760 RepID=A0AAV9SN10_9TELE
MAQVEEIAEDLPAPPPEEDTSETEERRRTVRPREEPSEVERALLEALQNRPPPPPPPRVYSSMEHFLLGLAPSLERLPLDKQEIIKFKLMQKIFEHSTVVLNLDHVDPQ